ncbi:hypothetical protein EHM69_08085 [candidate division KSB1 bacterium]|nr:MAG: hypothetical protein EHM69_08085 [candidate division KSB1 bacterium]
MKRAIHFIIVASALCASTLTQSADVAVLNGDITLTISTAAAGQAPDAVVDETGQLEWSTFGESSVKKITVQTGLASPRYSLRVEAFGVSGGDGTATGDVPLSTVPTNLIEDIPTDVPVLDPGTCTLRYTASAAAGNGTGADSHTITFTIVDQ